MCIRDSSNIATVSNTGIVTAQGTGTTYIELKDEQKMCIRDRLKTEKHTQKHSK